MSLVFIVVPSFPSGLTRGKQIAERLNAQCNPADADISSTFILVKVWHQQIIQNCKNVYYDILDDDRPLRELGKYPNVKIIAQNYASVDYIKARVDNEVIVIPHHHCNYENVTRPKRDVKIVGYCGGSNTLNLDTEELTAKLKNIGLEFRIFNYDRSNIPRQEICKFYSEIDIHISFRKISPNNIFQPELKAPVKLVNASSFKVPTVAYPETGWQEGFDTFIHAESIDKLIGACKILKEDDSLYDQYAEKAYEFAKDYHIEKIVTLYSDIDRTRQKIS